MASLTTIRMLVALGAFFSWLTYQLDFVTAFLNSELNSDVYMHTPDGVMGEFGFLVQPDFEIEKGAIWTKTITSNIVASNEFSNILGFIVVCGSRSEPIYYSKKWKIRGRSSIR